MIIKKLINEAKGVPTGLGLSLTKIKTYEACPYKYFLQVHKKVKTDPKAFNPKFFKIGQFAHKYIESKIKGIECKFNSTTLTQDDKDATMGNCQNVFSNPYISSLLDKGKSEQAFSLYITPESKDGLEVKSTYSRKADFSGYIDFYAIDKGVVHIIDWKTGSVHDDSDETFMQIMLYAKAVQKLEKVNKFKLSYFYLDHNKLSTREFTEKELNLKIETIVNKGIDIPQANDEFLYPANPGQICKYCQYSKELKATGIAPCKYV